LQKKTMEMATLRPPVDPAMQDKDRVQSADPLPHFGQGSLHDPPDVEASTGNSLSELQSRVDKMDKALQENSEVSVTWRRLSIFLMILLACIVATTTIIAVAFAAQGFDSVKEDIDDIDEDIEDTEMDLDTLEAKIRADGSKISGLYDSVDNLRAELSKNQSELFATMNRLEGIVNQAQGDLQNQIQTIKADVDNLKQNKDI